MLLIDTLHILSTGILPIVTDKHVGGLEIVLFLASGSYLMWAQTWELELSHSEVNKSVNFIDFWVNLKCNIQLIIISETLKTSFFHLKTHKLYIFN